MANVLRHPPALLLPAAPGSDPGRDLKLEPAQNPLPRGTVGGLGLATNVTGAADFPLTILLQPFDPAAIAGIDPGTVRVFYWDARIGALKPVWNSGVNAELGYAWAKIRRPGIYVPIGLPRDPVIREFLASLAAERVYASTESPEEMHEITRRAVAAFLAVPHEALAEVRKHVAIALVHNATRPVPPPQLEFGRGFHVLGFKLPQNAGIEEFKEAMKGLETPPGGLPEEALFLRPEVDRGLATARKIGPEFHFPSPWPLPFSICFIRSRDWYMYHADRHHTGDAHCSNIRSTNVGSLTLRHAVAVDATISSIPSIVDGKIYIGTGQSLYKIDVASGVVNHTFTVASRPAYQPGIGGSPAIVDGRVFFTAVPGLVYCLDAHTFAIHWVTDLRNADASKNQPVTNPQADSWTGPLVVNGRVYVGCGEGESGAFGFVFCLDAHNGHVKWLFSTNKFSGGSDNSPNVIPASAVGIPLPPGFSSHPDPPTGVSVWSSPAYDAGTNRIFVGTGNSSAGDFNPNPDVPYGSGVLSLDAHHGHFKGFFSPPASDCYRPNDTDVDVCGSPAIFSHGGKTFVAIGSKSGAFWLLDAANIHHVHARRQMLPYDAVTSAPLPNVDPHAGPSENLWGVFGTPAVDSSLRRLFVGIGGYAGIGDSQSTPFMRALNWHDLDDAWATHVDTIGANKVSRYTVPRPPMYTTNEAGLSSPAVVNDVVLVSTNSPGLYAFCAHTGLCLWQATGLIPGFILGPAIYEKHVVVGTGSQVNIYSL